MLGTSPNFEKNFLIQTASLAMSESAMYSPSVIESTIVSCLDLFQLATPLMGIKYTHYNPKFLVKFYHYSKCFYSNFVPMCIVGFNLRLYD